MMDLDEAIQHCKEQVQEQAKKGCYSCAEEHHQLAEWLKELKAYREKLNCTDCVIDGTDACPRGAGRAVDDEICGDFMPSRSEIPNTCGDAISREELIEALNTWDKFGYAPTHELIPLRGSADKDKYVPYIHYDDVIKCIKGMPSVTKQPCDDAISRQTVFNLMRGLTRWCVRSEDGKWKNVGLLYDDVMFGIDGLPSVTPQQRTGRWIEYVEPDDAEPLLQWRCDNCGTIERRKTHYCPNCGCAMKGELE